MKKNKTKTILIVIAIIIVVAIILFFVLKKKKNNSEKTEQESKTETNVYKIYTTFKDDIADKSLYSSLADWNGKTTLKYGDINKGVYMLQVALNKIHNAGLEVDGNFGNNTQNALKSFYNATEVDSNLANKILKDFQK